LAKKFAEETFERDSRIPRVPAIYTTDRKFAASGFVYCGFEVLPNLLVS